MKRMILLVLLTFNFLCILNCHAELFDGSVHFYVESGESLNANTKIQIIYFDYNAKRLWTETITKHTAGENLQKDRDYYYNMMKGGPKNYYWSGEYQPSLSTSSRDVHGKRWASQVPYTGPWYPGAPAYETHLENYYIYRGFAKDKSSYVYWKEDLDGNILQKTYYTEVSIDDLMPKAVNRDFLYD